MGFANEEEGFEPEDEPPVESYVWELGAEGHLKYCAACKQPDAYWHHGLCNTGGCVANLVVVERQSSASSPPSCIGVFIHSLYRSIYILLGHAMPSVLVCASHNMYVCTHQHNHLMFIYIC